MSEAAAVLGELMLKRAVQEKKVLRFTYQGKVRVVSPYLLGKTADKGLVLHAIQTGGESSKGPVSKPEWRFFYLNELGLSSVEIGGVFLQADLKKTEGAEYKLPKFITEVVAIHPKE